MKIAEVTNSLKTYIATVRVNGAAHKTTIQADKLKLSKVAAAATVWSGQCRQRQLLKAMNWQKRAQAPKSWMLASSKSKPWQIKLDGLLNRSGSFKRGKALAKAQERMQKASQQAE
jgi:hypothetical protein